MNKVYGQGESPYDNEVETVPCDNCLGSGELFVPSDEEGVEGFVEPCKCCSGTGQVPESSEYGDKEDYYEDYYENGEDRDYDDDIRI